MKKKIVAGLLIWIPIGGTILIIHFLFDLFDKIWLLVPYQYHPEQLFGFKIPGLSFVLVSVIIFITGHLVSNYFGDRLVSLWESLLDKIPGIRTCYRGIKQMTEAIFASDRGNFQKVYLIEYPRKGLWTVAFETSNLNGEPHYLIMEKEQSFSQDSSREEGVSEYVNLFIPTTPNPTSGYFIVTNRSDLLELEMSADDALKMIVSGGIFVPPRNIKENN